MSAQTTPIGNNYLLDAKALAEMEEEFDEFAAKVQAAIRSGTIRAIVCGFNEALPGQYDQDGDPMARTSGLLQGEAGIVRDILYSNLDRLIMLVGGGDDEQ